MTEKSNIPVIEMPEGSVFRHFFMCNPLPMWLFGTETLAFLCVNQAATDAYGYTEEEFLKMAISDIGPKEDVPTLQEYVARNIDMHQESSFWRHLKKDGSLMPVKITSFLVFYNGKKARMTTANDITLAAGQSVALAKAYGELGKLSLVAKLTGNMVMILDASHEIIWVNDAFTALTGYTLAEAVGKCPSTLLRGPQSSTETKGRIRCAIVQKKPFTEEMVQYSKNGKPFWTLIDGQPVPKEDGSTAEYIIVETDITELKEKKAAIKASEMQMNIFFESTDSLHILFDTSYNVLTHNKLAEEFVRNKLGRNLAAGESMAAIVPESIQQQFMQFATDALKGATTANREARIPLGGHNDCAWWMVSYIPAHDCFGNIMGVAFTAHDITERKKAEEKIARQNKVFSDIAWKQSHLVRAPLANILSLTNLMQIEGFDPALLAALGDESKKLDAVIKGIVHKTLEERVG
jgi:PAS domain S-box-containing protein